MLTQLPLPFPSEPTYAAADLIAAPSNQAALSWLEQAEWPDNRLAIWGPPGCGKTHIVTVWARSHVATLLQGGAVTTLDDLPESGPVVIDDADQITGEHLLLHLLNTARDRALRILMASSTPPSRWPVQLPDLSSRLRSITAVPIHALEDELLQAVLIRMQAERQLDLSPQVRAWLLLHLPRSTQALRTAIALLDAESIRSAKLITRTWAERILTENGLVPPKPTDRIRGDQAAERQ